MEKGFKVTKKAILAIWHASVVKEYVEFLDGFISLGFDVTLIQPYLWPEISANPSSDYPKAIHRKGLRIIQSSILRLSRAYHAAFFIYNPFVVIRELIILSNREGKSYVLCMQEPYSFAGIQITLTCLLINIFNRANRPELIFFTAQNIHRNYPFPISSFYSLNLRIADAIITCSEIARGSLKARTNAKLIYFHLGLPQKLVNGIVDKKKLLFHNESVIILTYCGRLVPEKGMWDLVTLLDWTAKDQSIKFEIIGDGILYDKMKRLEGYFPHLSVSSSLDKESLFERLSDERTRRINLLLSRSLPNWSEQYGRTISEAAALGIPTVAYDSGDIKYTAISKDLIAKEGDIYAVYKLIQKLKDPQYFSKVRSDHLIKAESRSFLHQGKFIANLITSP